MFSDNIYNYLLSYKKECKNDDIYLSLTIPFFGMRYLEYMVWYWLSDIVETPFASLMFLSR